MIQQVDELHMTQCDDESVAGGFDGNNMVGPMSLFVLAGQSNMAGRGQLLPPLSSDRRTSLCDNCHCCRDQDIIGVGVDSTSSSSSSTCHRCYVSLPHGACQAADAFRPRVVSYDPLLGWTHEAGASLHANVDILKRATVGIGPGSSFAIEYLRLRDLLDATDSRRTSGGDSSGGSVGLIPVSVGSTFLAEWTADYLPKSKRMMPVLGGHNAYHVATARSARSDISSSSTSQPNGITSILDYDVSVQGFVNAPPNAQWHPFGCSNLMSCAMRTIYRALLSLPVSHQNVQPSSQPHHDADARGNGREWQQQRVHALPQLTGLLWYQGENDCSGTSDDGDDESTTASAHSYGDRCAAVIGQFRLLATAVTELARMARGEAEVDATRNFLRNLIIARAEGDTEKDKSDNADGDQGTAALQGDQEPSSVGTIPVVSVAVTTTRPWLVHLPTIRQQQLAMPTRVAHLSVVDAFGCTLQPDGNNHHPHTHPSLAPNTSL